MTNRYSFMITVEEKEPVPNPLDELAQISMQTLEFLRDREDDHHPAAYERLLELLMVGTCYGQHVIELNDQGKDTSFPNMHLCLDDFAVNVLHKKARRIGSERLMDAVMVACDEIAKDSTDINEDGFSFGTAS